jgi:membrane-bound serine protease (ClpP class)
MDFTSVPYVQDLAYLVLLAAVWTTILAVIMPGTGVIEGIAGVCIFISAFTIFELPKNLWALPLIFLGVIAFFLELRWPARGIFVLVSILLSTIGSAFLFRGSQGELAGVAWWIAAIGSLLTAGFFWLAFSTYMRSGRSVMDFSADTVVGQIGIAKTEISIQGTVQVASALWSAKSDVPIPLGSRVRVIARHGLVLTVQKEG